MSTLISYFGTRENATKDIMDNLTVDTTLSTSLEGEEYKRYILYKSTGVGINDEIDGDIKEKLFTSLAYEDLYSNKPNKLYNIIEEYAQAGILSLFGISLDKFLELSHMDSKILVESAMRMNKEATETEEDMLKKLKLGKDGKDG